MAVLAGNTSTFRLVEAKGDKLLIDVHVISPGWGSSGYYSEAVLRKACEDGVYPVGMHMHLDHPSRTEEEERPARTLRGSSPIAAVLIEAGHYEPNGWDGPGIYAKANVLPSYIEDIRALDSHIGVSHYVDGTAEPGEAEGRKGPIIVELTPSPLNTVDFVTVAGRGGSYRTISEVLTGIRAQNEEQNRKNEESMADPTKMTLKEVMEKYPEIVTELREQFTEEFKADAVIKEQATKLTEATAEIKLLKEQLVGLKRKLAETEARKYLAEEIGKAKLPDASVKVLTESLLKQVPLTDDGAVDQAKFAGIVTAEVKAKVEEVEAIRKESGIKGNGGGAPAEGDSKALVESFESIFRAQGKSLEVAKQMAEIAAGGR
ncbi:hypothetical protein [Methanoculleus sp.]|uniref:hypothetical protein n=1 Tax=Methanoculleus sp. TaxID=90427 RepID=UPI001BD54375|nr:hypothetical protein [Methanoculleus sp.]